MATGRTVGRSRGVWVWESGCDLAVSPSADTRLFCSDADAALWAEGYCDSFKDVQTIGVVFGAFWC